MKIGENKILKGVTEAGGQVIVDHPDCLHKCIADGRAREFKAPFHEIFAHKVGNLRTGGKFTETLPFIHYGHAIREAPDVTIE